MHLGRGKSRNALVALAIVALLVGAAAGTAVSSSSGGGSAEVAKKKKCKKGKKGADSAKKKKCKKKKKKPAGPAPEPTVRATLSWDQPPVDLDLYVFDTAGNSGRLSGNAIPSSSFATHVANGLTHETFTDQIFNKPGRAFSFGVCYQDGGNNPTIVSLVYIMPDGTTRSGNVLLNGEGASQSFDGGAPIPANFCNA
jgi:hypothetical protein